MCEIPGKYIFLKKVRFKNSFFPLCGKNRSLQVVSGDVSLHGVLDRVRALEELGALLLLVSPRVSIQVLVQKLPHVIGKRQDLEVLSVLESVLELLGHGSVVFGLPHDFADESLLAVEVIVVEVLVQVLEEGDPLDDVQGLEVVALVGRSILGVIFAIILLVVLIILSIIVVVSVVG